jgi:hypothetical protein
MSKMEIPEINKIYNYFDDGKISVSRREPVKITAIIPFNEIDSEILDIWKDEIHDCPWLYNETTDYFCKGHLLESQVDVTFVRTKNNGWFSLGWFAGRLDIDGSLNKTILVEININ